MKTSLILFLLFASIPLDAEEKTKQLLLLEEQVIRILSEEVSGETAKRNLEYIVREHRMRGSKGFRSAAEFIAARLKEYGLSEVKIEAFPADGKIFYGTQRSRPAWNADFAELWEVKETANGRKPAVRLASWEAMPMSLAQDSESAEVTAELVDVGPGTSEDHYRNLDVAGKILLTSSQPAAVVPLGVRHFKAAGIVSYAQNQRSAWWGEDDNLVRWGHLDTFSATPTFAFMVSLKQARDFQKRLQAGETIELYAKVKAEKSPGAYHIVTAIIPGSNPEKKNEEIAYSCHLDHPRPGANDNASGCSTILEVARTLSKAIREKKIAPPARTIRFVWPPEIEGTITLLNARPELARNIRAVIHMDMVGGSPETKAVFNITRGPASLPSFIYDVAEHLGEFVNSQSAQFANTGVSDFPLVAPEGGKEPLKAEMREFTMGSDHQIYSDSSFKIPVIYMNDWPDRYIHTNFDTAANIDPTKLKRAGFIGAASGLFLANLDSRNSEELWKLYQAKSIGRVAQDLLRPGENQNHARFRLWYEQQIMESFGRFFVSEEIKQRGSEHFQNLQKLIGSVPATNRTNNDIIYKRSPQPKGTMEGFGYDYFADRFGQEKKASVRLFQYKGLRADGETYTYEVLNFVDGRRTLQEICDLVSAAYGPVPLEMVQEYLEALHSIGVLQK